MTTPVSQLQSHLHPTLRVQIATLFEDLDDEISSGSYINSLGQAQSSDSLRTPFASNSPVATRSVGALSSASSPLSSQTPNAVALSQTVSSDTLPPAAKAPRPSKVSGGPQPLATHSASSSESASGSGGHKSPPPPATAVTRGRSQPLARPHRAAVRAVLSMPCNTIPEDDRAEFDPLPPFVSTPTPASPGPPEAAPASKADTGGKAAAVRGSASIYDDIQQRRVAKVEGAAAAAQALHPDDGMHADCAGDAHTSGRGSAGRVEASGDAAGRSAGAERAGAAAPEQGGQGTAADGAPRRGESGEGRSAAGGDLSGDDSSEGGTWHEPGVPVQVSGLPRL